MEKGRRLQLTGNFPHLECPLVHQCSWVPVVACAAVQAQAQAQVQVQVQAPVGCFWVLLVSIPGYEKKDTEGTREPKKTPLSNLLDRLTLHENLQSIPLQ